MYSIMATRRRKSRKTRKHKKSRRRGGAAALTVQVPTNPPNHTQFLDTLEGYKQYRTAVINYENARGYQRQRDIERANSLSYFKELIIRISDDTFKRQIVSDLAMRVLYILNDEDNEDKFESMVKYLMSEQNTTQLKYLAQILFNPVLKDEYIGNPVGYLNHVNDILFLDRTTFISPEQRDKVNAFIEFGILAPISPKTVGYDRPSTPGGLTSAQWARVFGPRN